MKTPVFVLLAKFLLELNIFILLGFFFALLKISRRESLRGSTSSKELVLLLGISLIINHQILTFSHYDFIISFCYDCILMIGLNTERSGL